MGKFIEGSSLNVVIEDLIRKADNYLFLISPYIKLHSRVKDVLKLKIDNHNLEITILFGKNEDRPINISKGDLEFLKEFPNIEIRYEKNLHAKYYASEDGGLITSMNLYDFSQNNNIEVGVYTLTPGKIGGVLKGLISGADDLDSNAFSYFQDKIEMAELLYKKEPQFEKSRFGMKTYVGSVVEVDQLNSFFPDKKAGAFSGFKNYDAKPQKKFTTHTLKKMGYCIRTGIEIPFNPKKPFCVEAFKEWNTNKDPNFQENYCHKSGRPSEGKTSINTPVCF